MKKITAKVSLTMLAIAASVTNALASSPNLDGISKPIVSLINALVKPALAIVGALGTLFCIILGVKFAKAEEPQEREKAKSHLKNAIIGFVLIFVLILALNLLMPILTGWVAENQLVTTGTSNAFA